MKVLAVIPARRGSTRLSEKPLRDIGGKTLIERVWQQAAQCKDIDDLYVATDDQEIFDISESFGAKVIMTSADLPSGSARVAAVSHILKDEWDIIVNVQGDMPFINPKVISQVITFFKDNFTKFSMATIAIPIFDEEEFIKNSSVKVVISSEGRALYFSRAPIPHSRDGDEWKINQALPKKTYGLKHIGLYVFKKDSLAVLEEVDPSPLEAVEKLEQLKALEKGYSIGVCIVDPKLMENSIEVDTDADLELANTLCN
jgi:3-deoxy-manno-octulosonate cytidylyltransferase (CMP-KDO synthetase)